MKKAPELLILIGFLVGVIGLSAVRFFSYKTDQVHYHANFALYINGQQDEFKSFTFYEEVQTCDVHDEDDTHGRAHMHGENNHIVHVHAHAVTWGQFFANLGYSLGDRSFETNKAPYLAGQDGAELTFILNGKKVDSVANKVIQSEDILLINYGKEDQATLQRRFDDIPRDAHQANITADPASCSGSESPTLTTRLKHALL